MHVIRNCTITWSVNRYIQVKYRHGVMSLIVNKINNLYLVLLNTYYLHHLKLEELCNSRMATRLAIEKVHSFDYIS